MVLEIPTIILVGCFQLGTANVFRWLYRIFGIMLTNLANTLRSAVLVCMNMAGNVLPGLHSWTLIVHVTPCFSWWVLSLHPEWDFLDPYMTVKLLHQWSCLQDFVHLDRLSFYHSSILCLLAKIVSISIILDINSLIQLMHIYFNHTTAEWGHLWPRNRVAQIWQVWNC